jgi:putative membrane protein
VSSLRPETATRPGAAEALEGWRRLDPRMLVVHPVREVGRALPVLFGVLLAGSSTGRGGLWGIAGTGIMVTFGILRWFTTTYRVTAEQVQVRRGVLRRQLVSVSLDRVRTVDVSASALHRLLGLVRVTVGTGLSDRKRDDALRLDGMSAVEAERLREELLHRGPAVAAPAAAGAAAVPAAGEEVVSLRPSWVAYAPFTLSGFLSVVAVLGFAWRVISETRVDPRRLGPIAAGYGELLAVPRWSVFVAVPVVLLIAVGLASVIGYVLSFWGFRLARIPGALHVTRGLISTRATTIEERRLRGVEVSEPLLLRAVSGARCIAIATGLRVGRGAERGGTLLMPPGPAAEARRVAAAVIRSAEPVAARLAGHGPRAHRRRYTRLLVALVPMAAALAVAVWLGPLPDWTWEPALALVPLAALLAFDRYRSLGHALADGFLVGRRGSLVRRRCMLACDGIIGWNLERSFFQRRAGLATLVATTAAGRQAYPVVDVPLQEALRLADEAVPGLLTPFLERS